MIVLLAGMPRSGSTFSFNVVRELLERRGSVYQEPYPSILPVIERSGGADHVLCKTHDFDAVTVRLAQLGALKSICTVRKPEDAIASWMETFGFDLADSIERYRAWLNLFERLRPYSLIIPYEQIDRQPWRAAWRIGRHLSSDIGPVESIRVARRYSKEKVKASSDGLQKDGTSVQDLGFSFYDRKTFFHRRHVSTLVSRSAAERIGKDAVVAIRNALKDEIDANGNLHR